MSKRSDLLTSIAETIKDYREGEIAQPTPDHIDRWIRQFDSDVQEPMLDELGHVLSRTYFDKETVHEFLKAVVENPELAGEEPCEFWKDVTFLKIQEDGNSQKEMMQEFDQILQDACDFQSEDCDTTSSTFFYLDDAVFTGNRVLNDLGGWIESEAPSEAHVYVMVIAYHRGGQYYARTRLGKTGEKARKKIKFNWWRVLEIEDRRFYINSSDVLRPTSIPEDELIVEYVNDLESSGFPPVLRQPGNLGENKFFSSESGRDLLEQEMFKAGVRIRDKCPHLGEYQRPLGNMVLKTLGFGALLVTYRNCPNNCPLAFWAGDPWYPLFPRKTN